MIRDLILDAQAAEPAIRFTCTSRHSNRSEPDSEHLAEDEHPDHEHRIDSRTTKVEVIGRQLSAHQGQVEHGSELASTVVGWNGFIKAKRIVALG